MRRALRAFSASQAPDGLERRIEQLKTPIRAEHGNALAEVVEGLALPFDHAVELPLEREFLRHIVEKEGHAAIVPAIGHDMHGSAVGAVPELVEGTVAIPGENFAIAPFAVVGLFGQQAALAKLIEKLRCRRILHQPGVVEAPNASERIVAVNELTVSAEHRDAGRDLVERAAVSGHLPFEFILGDRERSDVESRPAASALKRGCDSLINLNAAVDDGLKLEAARLLRLAQAKEIGPLPRLEKLDLLLYRFVPALCVDGVHIGRVDPCQSAFGIAQPDRDRQAVEQAFAVLDRLLQALVLADQADKFLVDG